MSSEQSFEEWMHEANKRYAQEDNDRFWALQDKKRKQDREQRCAAFFFASLPDALNKAKVRLAQAKANLNFCVCDAQKTKQLACVCFRRINAEVEMAEVNLAYVKMELGLE